MQEPIPMHCSDCASISHPINLVPNTAALKICQRINLWRSFLSSKCGLEIFMFWKSLPEIWWLQNWAKLVATPFLLIWGSWGSNVNLHSTVIFQTSKQNARDEIRIDLERKKRIIIGFFNLLLQWQGNDSVSNLDSSLLIDKACHYISSSLSYVNLHVSKSSGMFGYFL